MHSVCHALKVWKTLPTVTTLECPKVNTKPAALYNLSGGLHVQLVRITGWWKAWWLLIAKVSWCARTFFHINWQHMRWSMNRWLISCIDPYLQETSLHNVLCSFIAVKILAFWAIRHLASWISSQLKPWVTTCNESQRLSELVLGCSMLASCVSMTDTGNIIPSFAFQHSRTGLSVGFNMQTATSWRLLCGSMTKFATSKQYCCCTTVGRHGSMLYTIMLCYN